MAEGGKVDPKMAEELLKATQAVKAAAAETTNSFQEQLRIITQMRDVMSQLADSTKSMGGESQQGMLSPDKWQEVTKRIKKAKNEAKSSSGVMTKLGKVMKSDVTKSALIATGAVTGLGQGFRNLFAVMKAGAGIIGKITGAAFGLGKALVSVPFKISSALQNMAAQGGGSNEVAQALEEIRDQYGSLKSGASQAIIQTSNNMMKMNETGVDSYRIFGNTAERLKLVTELANGMGASFGVFQDEIAANGTAIISYQKGLGLTNEQMGSLASNAMRMGKGVAQVQNEMTKQAVGMSKAFGVNAKVLSKDMGKAMADLAHFGHLSTKEMAIAATFANKLGVSVDKLTSVMDATSTFDQAAEGMSKLNEQFGTNIDATAIMSAQNPAEKVEILRKEFAKTGKSVESMSYQERMLIKQSSGLSDEMMNAAFSAKNAGVSLDAIQRQGSKNEKKTLSQADAMHELADSIKRLTPSGDAGSGSIFDRFLAGFGKGIMGSKEFIKLMNNIREIFRIASIEGVKLGKTFVDLFPGVKDILQGLQGVFNPQRFKKMFGDINKTFREFASSGSQDSGKLMENLQKNFLDFFDSGKGPGKKVLDGFGKFFEAIAIIFGKLSEWLVKKMADGVTAITNFIKNPQIPKVPGAPGGSKIMEAFSGVLDAFKLKLWPALKDLGKLLWEKFVAFFKESVLGSTAGKVAIGAAIATVIAPAAVSALGGAAAGGVFKKAGGQFMGNAAGALKDAAIASQAGEGAAAAAQGAAGAAGGGEMVSKAASTISSSIPDDEVLTKLEAASRNKIDFKGLTKLLGGMAMIITVGLVSMLVAIGAIKTFNINLKEIALASVLLLAMAPPMAAAGLLAIEALKVGQLVDGAKKELTTGMVAMGVVILAMAAAGAVMGGITKLIGVSDMKAGADMMEAMSNAFMKSGVVIGEAMLIGAIIISSAGIAGGAAVAGFAAMTAAVIAMVATASSIVNEISKLPGNPSQIATNVMSFVKVMDSIANMMGQVAGILKSMDFGFFETSTDQISKINATKDMIKALINGEEGDGGIQGVINTVLEAVKGMDATKIQGAAALGGILSAVSSMMGSVGKGAAELQSNSTHWYQSAENDRKAIKTSMSSAKDYISGSLNSSKDLIRGVIDGLKDIPADSAIVKTGPAIGGILQAVSSILQTISPNVEKFRSTIQRTRKDVNVNESKIDTAAISSVTNYMTTVLTSMKDNLPPLIKSIMSGVGDELAKLNPNQLKALPAVGSLLQALAGIISSINSASKGINMGDINVAEGSNAVIKITNQIPDVKKIIEDVSNSAPDLLKRMIQVAKLVPEGNFKGKIETLSLVFKTISDIINAVGSVMDSTKIKEVPGMGQVNSILIALRNVDAVLWGMLHNWMHDNAPTVDLIIQHLTQLGALIKNPADLQQKSKNLVDLFESINKIITAVNTPLKNIEGNASETIKKNFEDIASILEKIQGPDAVPKIIEQLTKKDGLSSNIMAQTAVSSKYIAGNVKTFTDNLAEIASSLDSIHAPDAAAILTRWTAVKTALNNIVSGGEASVFSSIVTDMQTMSSYTKKVIGSQLATDIKTIQDMVAKVQELDNSLANIQAIDMKAKLTALSKGLGLGSSGVYTVQSKDVVININMTVTMNAGEVERVIIGRSESVIRDRINFAIDKGGKADPKAKEALVKPNVEGNAGFYGRGIANSGG